MLFDVVSCVVVPFVVVCCCPVCLVKTTFSKTGLILFNVVFCVVRPLCLSRSLYCSSRRSFVCS